MEVVLIILPRCTSVIQEIMLTETEFFIVQTMFTLKVCTVYSGTNIVVGINIIPCHSTLPLSVKQTGANRHRTLKTGNLYNQQMLKFKILDLLLWIPGLLFSTTLGSNNLTIHS